MRLRVFPTVTAPGEARRGLSPLAELMDEVAYNDLRTVISELVTISVAHGAKAPIDLILVQVGDAIEGIVYDQGAGTRAIVRAKERRDSSLVLRIIESLVDDWGANPGETRIWFRMGARPSSR